MENKMEYIGSFWKFLLLVLLIVTFLLACDISTTDTELPTADLTAITIEQGIVGRVWF